MRLVHAIIYDESGAERRPSTLTGEAGTGRGQMRIDLSTTSKQWRIVALVAAAAATAAVVSTYAVFNNTYDEPAHIATGMEWLDRGAFTLDPQHPPLSRVASALLPWIAGEKFSSDSGGMYGEGQRILGRGEHYVRMLTLARLGHLPFFLILVFVTWYWTRRLADERTAAFAVGFVVTNPNLLAHAGLAGTDTGPAAMMPAALLAWSLWLETPDNRRSVIMGALVALCGLTKFSALAYWMPAAMVVALLYALRNPGHMFFVAGARRMFRPFILAFATASAVTWAMYRFHVGPVGNLTLPAPELWLGVQDFFGRAARGHPSFLLGEVGEKGWWYYDLVVLTVKTPIPLMLFAFAGALLALAQLRRIRRAASAENGEPQLAIPLVGVASILLIASFARVDLGIRLDLPIYPLMAILAALGLSAAISRAQGQAPRIAVFVLGVWALVVPAVAHPDHIAYFNPFAGRHPAKIVVESNLDWGQDLYRLRDAASALRMDSLRVHYFGTAAFNAVGMQRARRLRPNERTTGWVAASETFYAGVWADTALHWLRAYEPVGRVGKSIRLYYIKPTP
jgi:hypothetical protein